VAARNGGGLETREASVTTDYRDGIAFTEGRYWPIEEAKISMLDWGFLRSDANQDTISVWQGRFFRLEDHLDRFARNIARLRFVCPYDRDQQREILMECLRRTGFRDAYVQMLMTRGRPPIGVRDLRRCDNKFHVFCLPYMWLAPQEARERGLHALISDIQRVPPESVDPTIKHYHWLGFEMGLFQAYDAGADTVILVDRDGNITEGPGFNVFIVEGGRLLTPERGVLDGMTRRTVIELCAQTNVRCELARISREQTLAADEVFLSSTAGGVVPVTKVDGRDVGDGNPGPVAARLNDLYWSKREAGWHGTPVDYRARAQAQDGRRPDPG
jgi:branched-chain amino acid aminotransferase